MELESASPELQNILIDCLPYSQHSEDLPGAVANFAMMVAQQFVLDGWMPFELQAGWNRSGIERQLEEARLVFIPPHSVVRAGQLVLQIVPPAGTDDQPHGRVIRLDRARFIAFEPPRHWRGVLKRIRSGMPLVGRSEHEWRMAIGRHEVPEDFKTVNRTYAIQRARLTAPLGWNARGLFSDYIADFHWVKRQLRWERFCIEVRDSILTTLRGTFAQIGSWRGESPRLVWERLPTVRQVEEAEGRLLGAGGRLDELLKPFR